MFIGVFHYRANAAEAGVSEDQYDEILAVDRPLEDTDRELVVFAPPSCDATERTLGGSTKTSLLSRRIAESSFRVIQEPSFWMAQP
ncbi:hypothetical protein [Sphingobium mellinum]|uniref:hypothetical protein n=1 Tax=Sphingobium mellinum TaxID=1387166 RepID=UPI0030EC2679